MSLTHFFSDFVTVYHSFRYSVFSWEGIREMLGRTSDRGWWGSLLQNQWRGTWLTFHLGKSQPFLTNRARINLSASTPSTDQILRLWLLFSLKAALSPFHLHVCVYTLALHFVSYTLPQRIKTVLMEKNWCRVTTSPMCSFGLRSADCGGHCNVHIHCSAPVPSLHNLTGLLAQLVAHEALNLRVVGSRPVLGFHLMVSYIAKTSVLIEMLTLAHDQLIKCISLAAPDCY